MSAQKLVVLSLILLGGVAFGQAQDDSLQKRAAAVKPRPEELKWRKIPWGIDLLEGQRVARAERRPIFLWGAASAICRTIDDVLKTVGPLKPREAKPVDPLPNRGAGVLPDGSVTLAIYARMMHLGQPDGPVMLDSVTLDAAEWTFFAPSGSGRTQEWTIPDRVARKLVDALAPVPRGMDFRPEGARKAELQAKVESVKGGKARILLSGTWEAEGVREGVPYSGSATSEGVALYDVEKKSLLSLLLVFTGKYGNARETRESGGVVEWKRQP